MSASVITIMDYGAGNIASVKRALDHLGARCAVTEDPAVIARADRLIFPGVGNAGAAMRNLNAGGMGDALREAHARGVPVLGICLGSQILFGHSQEDDAACLGLLPGRVRRFADPAQGEKIPHMGWNTLRVTRPHPLLEGVGEDDRFYFVHSYYIDTAEAYVAARCAYIADFPAAVAHKNLFAVQFHPEKSGPVGLALLGRFCAWEGGA